MFVIYLYLSAERLKKILDQTSSHESDDDVRPEEKQGLSVGDEVSWKGADEDLSPGSVGRITINFGDGDVEAFFPNARNEQKLFTFAENRLNVLRRVTDIATASAMSHSSEGMALRAWLNKKVKKLTKDEEDEEDPESESDDSDGMDEEDENNSEDNDERWAPPKRFHEYVSQSEWSTEAKTLCVRIISASHLPAPTGEEVGLESHRRVGEDGEDDKQDSEEVIARGGTSIDVELMGAPCDCKKWATSKAITNDGVKHIFDQAVVVNVAEPRLALLKLTVLRKGVPIAQTVVPVHRMRTGLRWTQLYDPLSYSDKVTADFLLTRLLVLVHLKPYVSSKPMSRLMRIGRSVRSVLKGGASMRRAAHLVSRSSGILAEKGTFPAGGDDELTQRFNEALEKAAAQAFWEASGPNVPPPPGTMPKKSAINRSKHHDSGSATKRASFFEGP